MNSRFDVDRLEQRRLLSGWNTVDDYNPAASTWGYYDVAADNSGNVYAVGTNDDSNYRNHGIVREKLAGSADWTTVLDYSSTFSNGCTFSDVATSPAGDLYVAGQGWAGGWLVLERPAGQSTFTVVDQVPAPGTAGWGDISDLAVDPAGNVFAVGETPKQVTVKSGGRTITFTEHAWTVRERAAGATSFSTVDQFIYSASSTADNYPCAITATASGIYIAGDVDTGGGTPEHWLVRKSANGGATWTTVSDYQPDPTALVCRAEGVTTDAAGNVYVSGETSQRYVISTSKKGTTYGYTQQLVVRQSSDGGASWVGVASASTGGSGEDVGFGMGTDAAGNVYVVHPQNDASGIEHFIIRSSAAGWQPVDDFLLAPGQSAGGFGFAAASDGALYAAGYGIDAAGIPQGIVRSLPASIAAPAQNVFSTIAVTWRDEWLPLSLGL